MSTTVRTIALHAEQTMVRFADVPNLTANALHPDLGDAEPLVATMKRQMCRDDHEKALRAAVKDGSVMPLNPHSYVPVPEWDGAQLMRAVMTRDEFEKFAGRLFVRVDVAIEAPEGAQRAGTSEPPPTKNWMLLVQTEATRRARLLKDACPNKHNLKDDLARWCKEHGVTTNTGIFPAAATIYRHALRGWKPPVRD